MSNTTTVTPYQNDTVTEVAALCLLGAAAVGGAMVKWLVEEWKISSSMQRQLDAERRRTPPGRPMRDLEQRSTPSRVTSTFLHLRDPDSLVLSARALGYQVEQPAQPAMRLPQAPYIQLRSTSGERLVIERATEGVVIHAAAKPERAQALVRQHTRDRAIEHFKSRGMEVTISTLPSATGEIIEANERIPAQRDGQARVRATVHADGRAEIDVANIKGRRCEEIVRNTADAMGGRVVTVQPKDAYYQLLGEPARVRRRV